MVKTDQPNKHTSKRLRQVAAVLAALVAVFLIAFATLHFSGGSLAKQALSAKPVARDYAINVSAADVPAYSGDPSVEVNANQPFFTDADRSRGPFETYCEFDELERCGQAYALVGPETMPQERRRSIGMIKPSGWQISVYDWIDGRYLFNRCHLIAFALAGENDNPYNLITGTRTMNAKGMLPYEERTAAYIDRTGNHVLYRVTPMFEGDNLVASGVLMEAESVEDDGAGICFCVWCYNVEPGVVIDYATGANRAGDPRSEQFGDREDAVSGQGATSETSEDTDEIPGLPLAETNEARDSGDSSQSTGADALRSESGTAANAGEAPASAAALAGQEETQTYVLNVNTHRFHHPDCASVPTIKEKNKRVVEATRSDLMAKNFKPCGVCKP